MIRYIGAALAMAAVSSAAPAARAADDAASDIRCMAVAITLAQNANPQLKSIGTLASLYYLGKLDGRTPGVDLEAGLKQEFGRMTPQTVQTEGLRCGDQLQARGKAVAEMGARLQAAAPKAP